MQVTFTHTRCAFRQTNTLRSTCWLCFSCTSEDILDICPPRAGRWSAEKAHRQAGSLLVLRVCGVCVWGRGIGKAHWWSRNHICLISHQDLIIKSCIMEKKRSDFSAGSHLGSPNRPSVPQEHFCTPRPCPDTLSDKSLTSRSTYKLFTSRSGCLDSRRGPSPPAVEECVCVYSWTCYVLMIKMCMLLARRGHFGWFSHCSGAVRVICGLYCLTVVPAEVQHHCCLLCSVGLRDELHLCSAHMWGNWNSLIIKSVFSFSSLTGAQRQRPRRWDLTWPDFGYVTAGSGLVRKTIVLNTNPFFSGVFVRFLVSSTGYLSHSESESVYYVTQQSQNFLSWC